jgi:carbamoyltransferase
MKILSIHDGHNATVCYLKDGRVISLVSEERFTDIKNQGGYPVNAVNWCLKVNNLKMEDFDFIVFPHLIYTHDYTRGYGVSLRHKFFYAANYFLHPSFIGSNKLIAPYVAYFNNFRKKAIRSYSRKFSFDLAKVRSIEHHLGHGYAALYSSGFQNNNCPVLIFTMDDSGDGVSSRVAVWNKEEGYKIIRQESSYRSVGNLYAHLTRYLGMKPGEHEYKIMGMAPYVPLEKSEKCFRKFLEYIYIDEEGAIKNRVGYGNIMLERIRKDFYLERFDNICAGVQRHFEYIVTEWVKIWQKKTGIKSLVFGGGCFMNVKANMLIAKLGVADNLYFCPSCGDESIAFGAACRVAEENIEKPIGALNTLYLGPSFSNEEVEKALSTYAGQVVSEKETDIEKKIAQLLSKGKIIGRFRGASEWGARALGNRSILCRADNPRIIHQLNKSIKNRDFWMPFAASILSEFEDIYLKGKKGLNTSFMTITFDSTAKAHADIIAALHPYDFTCRPQVVRSEDNPEYYRILSIFKEITGLGGVLNTSFNLHGFPVVGSPEAALRTLVLSQLDYLAIEDYLVWRR